MHDRSQWWLGNLAVTLFSLAGDKRWRLTREPGYSDPQELRVSAEVVRLSRDIYAAVISGGAA